MPAPLINNVPQQFFTDAGAVAASHKLYSYAAGTTNAQDTFSDSGLTTANANPIVLDSAGRATIFLNPALGLYKFVLKNSDDSATLWTRDNVGGFQDVTAPFVISGTAGETMSLAGGETFPLIVFLSDGSGGQDAGKWYIASSSNDYSSNDATAVGFFGGDAVAADGKLSIQLAGRVTGFSALTAGNTYAIGTLGQVGATGSGKRNILFADSTTTGIILPTEAASQTAGPLPAISGNALSGLTKIKTYTATASGNVGTGEDELYTTDGLTLTSVNTDTNGDYIRGEFWGTGANNANAKTIRIRFKDDDTVVGPNNNLILQGSLTASKAIDWRLNFTLVRTSSTTFHSDALLQQADSGAFGTIQSKTYNNTTGSTVAWDGTVGDAYVQITGEATANDDIQLLGGVLTIVTQA